MAIVKTLKKFVEMSKEKGSELEYATVTLDLNIPVEGSSPEDSYMSGGWSKIPLSDILDVDKLGVTFAVRDGKTFVVVPWTAISNLRLN